MVPEPNPDQILVSISVEGFSVWFHQLRSLEMEIPWPQEGDKVFVEGPRACCMATECAGSHELGIMAAGYKEASDILVEHVERHGRNDALVYPIIFGYRQYLELRIKALVVIVNRSNYSEEAFQTTHDFHKLWNPIRSCLWKELQKSDRIPFQIVENVINDFQGIDPKSDGFRFPSNIKQFNIDLANLRDVMNRVSMFLDSLSDYWHAGVDAMPDPDDL